MATRRLEVELVGDPSSFTRSLGTVGRQVGALERRFGTLGRTTQGALGVAGNAMSRFGQAARTAAPYVGIGLTAGIVKSISAASDLGEQVNKTAVVFAGAERPILRWSKTTADAFGVSREAALEAAGTFGNMLVPMGFARDEAAQMSRRMVELASDLASFNNASPEETLEALRAGLAGETEPLRRFGIFLNDARVAQEALGDKTATSTMGLSEQEKAAARLAVIIKDTKDAQGDFARTSDSLANQQRILRAQFENTAATLGKSLMPVAAQAAEVASGALDEVNKILSDRKLSDEQKFDAIADMIEDGFIEGIDRLGDLAPQIGKAAVHLAGRAAGAFVTAWWESDIWGKLFLTGVFIRAVGGPGVFTKLGSYIGGLIGRRMATTIAAETAGSAATGGIAGRAGTVGKLGMLGRAIPGVGTVIAGVELARAAGINPGGDMDDRFAEMRREVAELTQSMGTLGSEERKVFRAYVDGLVESGAATQEWADKQMANFAAVRDAQRPVTAGFNFAKVIAKDGKASDREIDAIIDKLGQLPKEARKEAAETMIGVAREFERKGRLPEGSARKIRRDVVAEFGDMKVKSVGESAKMVQGIGKTFVGLVGAVTSGLETIGENTNEALRAFGVKPLKFSLKSGTGLGGFIGAAAGNAAGFFGGDKRAAGGRIPGYSAADNHLIAVRGGERVLTPERQFPIADAAMWNTYGMGLDDLLAATGGIMHSRGGRAPGYAPGGIVPVPGFPGERINRAVLPAWQALRKRFNLFLTDAYGPGHRSPEHTQFGTAVDVIPGAGGSWGDVGRAVGFAVRSGYTPVYYDGSHGSINLPPHGPGHHAHITLLTAAELAAGKRPGGGAAIGRIARLRLAGPAGPLRDLGQGSLDAARQGANRLIGRRAAFMGAHGPGAGRAGKILSQPQIASLWRTVNPGVGDPHLMSAIAMAESSGNVAAHGPPDGRGLYQIEWPIWGGALGKFGNPYVAAANTRMAREVLQRQGLGAWVVYNTGAYQQFMRRGGVVGGRAGRVARRFAAGGRNRPIVGAQTFYAPPLLGVGKAKGFTPAYSYQELLLLSDIALTEAQQATPDDFADDISVLTDRGDLLAKRKAKIQRRLDKTRDPERRQALLEELASLTSELASNSDQIADLRQQTAESNAALAEEIKALRESIDQQTAVMNAELSIGLAEARRALADVISGELGGREFLQAQTAGAGSVHNY